MPRRKALLAATLAVSCLFAGNSTIFAAELPRTVNGKHVMWGAGQGYPSTEQISANNLIYHGGTVETVPAVYLVYWGTEWQGGFSAPTGPLILTQKTRQS